MTLTPVSKLTLVHNDDLDLSYMNVPIHDIHSMVAKEILKT